MLKLMVSAAVEGSIALATLKEGFFAADCTRGIVGSWSLSHMYLKSNNLRLSRKGTTHYKITKQEREKGN